MNIIYSLNEALERKYFLTEGKADRERFEKFAGKELADKFDELKASGRVKNDKENKKDYADYGYWEKLPVEELEKFVANLENTPTRGMMKKGAELYYQGHGWKIYIVKTYDAAKYLGEDTTWCITGRYGGEEKEGRKWFNHYKRGGVKDYYFLIPDNDPKGKWCFLDYADEKKFRTKQIFFNSANTWYAYAHLGTVMQHIPVEVLATLPRLEDLVPYERENNFKTLYDKGGWTLERATGLGMTQEFPNLPWARTPSCHYYYIIRHGKRVWWCTSPESNADTAVFWFNGKFPRWVPALKFLDNSRAKFPTALLHCVPGLEDYQPYSDEGNWELYYEGDGWTIHKATLRGMNAHVGDQSKDYGENPRHPYYVLESGDRLCVYMDRGSENAIYRLCGSLGPKFEALFVTNWDPRRYDYNQMEELEKIIPIEVLRKLPRLKNLGKEDTDGTQLVASIEGWKIYKAPTPEVAKRFPQYTYYLSNKQIVAAKNNYILTNGGKTEWCYFDKGSNDIPRSKDIFISNGHPSKGLSLWSGVDAIFKIFPLAVLEALPHLTTCNEPFWRNRVAACGAAVDGKDEWIHNGVLYYDDDVNCAYLQYLSPYINSVVVSNTVRELDRKCLEGLDFTSIKFEPEPRIKTIGDSAIAKCDSLKTITIPKSVSLLCDCAIWGCDSLEQITFEDGDVPLTLGRECLFRSKIKELTLPARLVSVKHNALWGMDDLEHLYVKGEYRPEIFEGGLTVRWGSPIQVTWVDAGKTETVAPPSMGSR